MKKNAKKTWTVVAKNNVNVRAAGGAYWRTLRVFDNPREADEWLTQYIKTTGYSGSDFSIIFKAA